MWSCNRRNFLSIGLAGLGLAGCGFTPAYGPGGGATRLQGQIALETPQTPDGFGFNQRFEERMGRGFGGAYRLSTTITVSQQDLGTTSAGTITRYRLIGKVAFHLSDAAKGDVLLVSETDAFTGYSTTGSTVATLAAERDARDRLMVLLADQVVDALILQAPDLPAPA
jgi:LPS-assembly lipoprotein